MNTDELIKEKLKLTIAIGWIDLIIHATITAAGFTDPQYYEYFNAKAAEYQREYDAAIANLLLTKTNLQWTDN